MIDGEIEIAGQLFDGPQPLIFQPGDRISARAKTPARDVSRRRHGPRHLWWNFASSSKERIEQAKNDWKTCRFASIPRETEFIPLPEE